MSNEMEQLRQQMDKVNLEILELINKRASINQEIGDLKTKQSIKRFDPVREREMLDKIKNNNSGPFQDSTLEHIFKEIFKASLELQEEDNSKALLVSRKKQAENTVLI